MYGIAFDVGENTGIVLAELERDKMPAIVRSTTVYNEKVALAIADADKFMEEVKGYPLGIVVVELPLITKMSDRRKAMEVVRGMWTTWIDTNFRNRQIPIRQISAVDWKVTPSGKIDVFKNQTDSTWQIVKRTRHEKDAAAMLHWYTVWKLGKL